MPPLPTPLDTPAIADLDDPLYYLRNFDTVVDWVHERHGDLLLPRETTRLAAFRTLDTASRGLLVRLVMRTGEHFRGDRLDYPELGKPMTAAVAPLLEQGWLTANPELSLTQAAALLTLPELRDRWRPLIEQAGLRRSLGKRALVDALAPHHPAPRPADCWGFGPQTPVLALQDMALFDRIRLMFFGNLYQGWSDFVLVQLGLQRYEPVPLSRQSRAFQSRAEVDGYLALDRCLQQLEDAPAAEVWPEVPGPFTDNPWLESRRGRLLFELGLRAERQGNRPLALAALAASAYREARLRYLRLLERDQQHWRAWELARLAQLSPRSRAEARGCERLVRRLAGKLGEAPPPARSAPSIREWSLTLPASSELPVELTVAQHLDLPESPVVYVENALLNGLFGLLCWPALYTPLPGAFFHPFHAGPADLQREDFVTRRRDLFSRCLAQLDDGRYRQAIRQTWRAKQGITNPFVAWSVLTEDVLELALKCIPPHHLRQVFERLLADLTEHRSGLPDLVRFDPASADYELIEVKGPGDRLQDHQRHWLEWFAGEGIQASVCYVHWRPEVDS
ncbi:MAG: VRR-NUC domain-containing protein [Marinobacter sp.]|uniref:VRR-NUC domain-containing protein n=1 Tax=Marinobacter sp. TaxID=50741 RepID=UPI00299D03AD|nr:VRR-NUC domain-containing protein [Marinobacter sp.]MDX1757364.1 VRR-NUC domain-containing protein [Marinobacter sp.]